MLYGNYSLVTIYSAEGIFTNAFTTHIALSLRWDTIWKMNLIYTYI